MEDEQKPRERSFISELVPDWRPTREQVLWVIRITIVIVALLGILTLIGLPFGITLWEWVKVLIVPAVIAVGGLWFNRQQRDREMEIAEERAQDEALQAYLDQMSQMLTDKERPLHRTRPGDNLSAVARAQTLTALTRLSGKRKGSVVRFLYESGLITRDPRILGLQQADLRDAELKDADLQRASLRDADLQRANLRGADLFKADLREAYVREAFVSMSIDTTEASLAEANLRKVDLGGADLREAQSGADLREAHLQGASLIRASLRGADLSDAYLTEANLSRAAGFSNEELERQAASLEGATMPDGQKYEDWLKGKKGRGKNEENSGPS